MGRILLNTVGRGVAPGRLVTLDVVGIGVKGRAVGNGVVIGSIGESGDGDGPGVGRVVVRSKVGWNV